MKPYADLFHYDTLSGKLFWKSRPRSDFKTNNAFVSFQSRCEGKEAGTPDAYGYRQITIDGQRERRNRVVWKMHNGSIPTGYEVDHENGVRSDDRIANLRLATKSHNQMNSKLKINNKSRLKGVDFHASSQLWRAVVKVGGKQFASYHPTKGLAAVARAKAALRYHGQFARLT